MDRGVTQQRGKALNQSARDDSARDTACSKTLMDDHYTSNPSQNGTEGAKETSDSIQDERTVGVGGFGPRAPKNTANVATSKSALFHMMYRCRDQ